MDGGLSPCVCVLFVLLGSLSRGQGGRYRAARLCHIEELLFISRWCYQAFVLVTPNHQVNKVIQELLRNVVCGSVLTPRHNTHIGKIKQKYNGEHSWSMPEIMHQRFTYMH